MTGTQEYQEAAKVTMQKVMKLLQITEEDYAAHRYQIGIAYLHWYLPANEPERRVLERSKLFWNWFKMLCTTNDECFLIAIEPTHLSLDRRIALYNSFHCPRSLARECKPNAIVLSELKRITI